MSLSSPKSLNNLKNCKNKWQYLKGRLMLLDKKNYVEHHKEILVQLRDILSGSRVNNKNNPTAVLAILYEFSVRELVTDSFPVSAKLLDNLTCNSSEMGIIQPLMREHLERLRTKLQNFTMPNDLDIGVLCLLLSLFKLDKIIGRDSAFITQSIEIIMKETSDYIELETIKTLYNDSLIVLVFCLIWYSIQKNLECKEILVIKKFIRKIIVSAASSLSTLSKVLSLDIIERTNRKMKKMKSIELYQAIYSKLFAVPDSYILKDVRDFLYGTPFPDEIDDEVFDKKIDLVNLPNGIRVEDDNDEKEEIFENSRVTARKPSDWDRKLSNETTNSKPDDDVEDEVLQIPERCCQRVYGSEGTTKRNIELESSTKIYFTKREEPVKPDSTPLTAHRLITGALGISAQMSKERVDEEKQKLQEAKVRRQNEPKERQEPMREIHISGKKEQIEKAKELVNKVITEVETIHVKLQFTVDEILRKHSDKLKTIESLVNCYIEIIEMEDESVELHISGDRKSCEDAKKLIFDELGSFRSQHGHLFFVTNEIMTCLINENEVNELTNTVQSISGGRLYHLKGSEGSCVFVSGFSHEVNKALNIFQKLNTELLVCMSSKSEDESDVNFNCEDLCNFIRDKFSKRRDSDDKTWRSMQPSLMNKYVKEVPKTSEENQRLIYTRRELIDLSKCEFAKNFPDSLSLALKNDPDIYKIILVELSKVPESFPVDRYQYFVKRRDEDSYCNKEKGTKTCRSFALEYRSSLNTNFNSDSVQETPFNKINNNFSSEGDCLNLHSEERLQMPDGIDNKKATSIIAFEQGSVSEYLQKLNQSKLQRSLLNEPACPNKKLTRQEAFLKAIMRERTSINLFHDPQRETVLNHKNNLRKDPFQQYKIQRQNSNSSICSADLETSGRLFEKALCGLNLNRVNGSGRSQSLENITKNEQLSEKRSHSLLGSPVLCEVSTQTGQGS